MSDFVRIVSRYIDTIPAPLPAIKHILLVLENPDSETKDIVDSVKLVTIVATKILKMANTYLDRGDEPILSLSRAVTLVGRNKIHSISVMADAVGRFSSEKYTSFKFKEFMHHTVLTALLAEELSQSVSADIPYNPDSFFSAGIVHNFGMLILNFVSSAHFDPILKKSFREKLPFSIAESVGESHSEIGALLLQKWGLPEEFVNVARYHHDPEGIYGGDVLVDIVHIAEVVASLSGGEIFGDTPVEPFCGNSLRRVGITPAVIKKVRKSVMEREGSYEFFWGSSNAY